MLDLVLEGVVEDNGASIALSVGLDPVRALALVAHTKPHSLSA